jgi:glycosyltransferase 2 family protein
MKKNIITAVQILVTLGILVWIFHDPQKRANILGALRRADPLWLLTGFIAYGLVEVFATVRWQILLRVQGIAIGWGRLFKLLMIGIFFNQFMPGGTGGDVVKIYYLLKETPGKKAQALLAALIDRVVGLLGLMLVAVFIVWKKYAWLQKTAITQNLTWSLLIVLAASVAGIAFSFLITGLGLVKKLPARMPMRDIFVDLSIAYNQYARAWKASLTGLAVSIPIHIGSFWVFYSAAEALRAGVNVGDFLAVMPIVNTIASLPVSVGGTGARELLFQNMLGDLCGVKDTDAWAISLTGFVLILAWGLIGGVIYLFYRPSEHARLRDIKHEVEELEHEIAEQK